MKINPLISNKIVDSPASDTKTHSNLSPLVQVVKKADEQGLEILSTGNIHSHSLTKLEGSKESSVSPANADDSNKSTDDQIRTEQINETKLSDSLEEFFKISPSVQIDPHLLKEVNETISRVRLLIRDNATNRTQAIRGTNLDEIKSYMARGDYGMVDKEDINYFLLPRNSTHILDNITTTDGMLLSIRSMTLDEEAELEEAWEIFLAVHTQVSHKEEKPKQEEMKESIKTSTTIETKVVPLKKEADKDSILKKGNKLAVSSDRKKVTARMKAEKAKQRKEIREEEIQKEELKKELSDKTESKERIQTNLLASTENPVYSHNLVKSHTINKISRGGFAAAA